MIGPVQGNLRGSTPVVNAFSSPLLNRRSSFKGVELHKPSQKARTGKQVLVIQNFKFLKDLGLKKPAFLPDFGLEKRKALLDKFFTSFDSNSLDAILADNAQIHESGEQSASGKQGYIKFVADHVKPSFPDFSWSHATNGEKDEEGVSIVKLEIAGKHTGQPFKVPGSDLPPIEAKGDMVSLPEQFVKVKVEDGQIKELKFLRKRANLGMDIYRALGGKAPTSV